VRDNGHLKEEKGRRRKEEQEEGLVIVEMTPCVNCHS
jgi:hypothetical protein